MPEDSPPPPDSRRARLWHAAESKGIPLRAILVTVAVVAAAWLFGKLLYRLRDVLLLILVSGFLALILNPLVVALQRWRIRRRGWAVAVVTLLGVLLFFGLTAAFGYPLVGAITHLADTLPSYVSKAEHGKGWIGHLVRRYNIQRWVKANVPKLVDFGKGLAAPALSVGEGAFTLVIALLTIFVLTVLLLLEGPTMRTGVLNLMSPERGERYTRVAREVNRSVTGYMLGNFLTSIIAGIVVFVTLEITGVPFAFLWALWVALVDFLPMIGGALAGIPTVLFALGHSLTAGIVTLVVFVVYTQIENHILNPIVMSRTVRVNPLLVLLSILVGAEIGSWIGGIFGAFVAALLAIPAAGAIQVLVRELWWSTRPRQAALPPGSSGPSGSGEPAGSAEPPGSGKPSGSAGSTDSGGSAGSGEPSSSDQQPVSPGQQPVRRP
jgi:predicted PurR-regulated permease PerM